MQRYANFFGLVVLILFSSHLPAEDGADPNAFVGVWKAPPGGNQEVLTLRLNEATVLGDYAFINQAAERYEGTLEGEVKGRQLEGRWQEHPSNQPALTTEGRFLLTLTAEGNRLEGWYAGPEGVGQTKWIMQRSSSSP